MMILNDTGKFYPSAYLSTHSLFVSGVGVGGLPWFPLCLLNLKWRAPRVTKRLGFMIWSGFASHQVEDDRNRPYRVLEEVILTKKICSQKL